MHNLADSFKETANFSITAFRKLSAVYLNLLLSDTNNVYRKTFSTRKTQYTPKESLLAKLLGNLLDPIDALSATFFSILFALLFTLSYGILLYNGVIDASFSSGYGTELFFAILGAVTIWGAIDGVMYTLTELFQRGERYRLLQYVQAADEEETAVSAIADELDFILEPRLTHAVLSNALTVYFGRIWAAPSFRPCSGVQRSIFIIVPTKRRLTLPSCRS